MYLHARLSTLPPILDSSVNRGLESHTTKLVVTPPTAKDPTPKAAHPGEAATVAATGEAARRLALKVITAGDKDRLIHAYFHPGRASAQKESRGRAQTEGDEDGEVAGGGNKEERRLGDLEERVGKLEHSAGVTADIRASAVDTAGCGAGVKMQVTEAQRQQMRVAFRLFDSNHDGKLSRRELKAAAEGLGFDRSVDMEGVIAKFSNGTTLDLAEFEEMVEAMQAQVLLTDAQLRLLRSAFAVVDADGSRMIDKAEFDAAIRKTGVQVRCAVCACHVCVMRVRRPLLTLCARAPHQRHTRRPRQPWTRSLTTPIPTTTASWTTRNL